jgi:hypothetical protein
VRLDAHGLAIELPRGWSGRVFARQGAIATLHAGNFAVVLADGEFGDRSTGAMPAPGAFIALTEYQAGAGLEPGVGLFAPPHVGVPLDPASFHPRRLAHPRPGQAGMQHFFTAAGRPFCLYVVLAGARIERRPLLAAVNHVLSSLRIAPRGAH